MFMVHLVGASHSFGVPVICIPENFEALMDKNIMHRKISNTVCKNAQSQGQTRPEPVVLPQQKESDAYRCIKYEEQVVALPPTTMVLMMMVFMEFPQNTMHNKFMGKPGHTFHSRKSTEKNRYPK
jgi:hypothetical protein